VKGREIGAAENQVPEKADFHGVLGMGIIEMNPREGLE